MKFQWKTLRKAFMDLNIERTGRISKREFKFFLNFWGLEFPEKDITSCFNSFDVDGDGFINYKDFQSSCGKELFPAEDQYFRFDHARQCTIDTCSKSDCFQPNKNNHNFCVIHQKMMTEEASILIQKLATNVGIRWPEFMRKL
jgi:hypothetical protein